MGKYCGCVCVHYHSSSKHIVSEIQNDEPTDRLLNELDGPVSQFRSSDYSNSYF